MSGQPPRLLRRHDPAFWLGMLFLGNLLLMRFSVLPNLSISATTALVLLWCFVGWRRGVLEVEPSRLLLWLVGAGAAALVPLLQVRLVSSAEISLGSWALWMVLWLPATMRFVGSDRAMFLRACRYVGWHGFGLAVLALLFPLSQAVGLPYRDYFAEYVPPPFQMAGFSTTVPIQWGSSIYKSNAWLALEPSFVSFMLGAALLAALIAGHRWWVLVTLLAGVLSSFAGSGLALLALGVVILILTGRARQHLSALVGGTVLCVAAALTPLGNLVFSRVGEVEQGQSSTALRATLPYEVLVPEFLHSVPGVLFGYGAGESRRVVQGTSVLGLLVPNPGKLIFDYGLLAGTLLLALLVAAHLRAPVPAISLPILVSFLFLQAATQPMINVLMILATWWAPTAYRLPARRGDPRDVHPDAAVLNDPAREPSADAAPAGAFAAWYARHPKGAGAGATVAARSQGLADTT